MVITEQVKKAAMAWRRNKEITNTTYMELTSDISLNYRREEVISNARTNWELLRSQTKCLTSNVSSVDKTLKGLKPDSDFVLTSLAKVTSSKAALCSTLVKSKTYANIATKVPILSEKKLSTLNRTSSQDTDISSQNTSTSNNSSYETFKLPPILVPIINNMEQKSGDIEQTKNEGNVRISASGSLSSSVGLNVDSSLSSLCSEIVDNQLETDSLSTSSSSTNSVEDFDENEIEEIIMDTLQIKEESIILENAL